MAFCGVKAQDRSAKLSNVNAFAKRCARKAFPAKLGTSEFVLQPRRAWRQCWEASGEWTRCLVCSLGGASDRVLKTRQLGLVRPGIVL